MKESTGYETDIQESISGDSNIQDMFGEYNYGSIPYGSDTQSPAIITIQNITIEGIYCTSGCTIMCATSCPAIVDIVVTWENSGESGGTFTPTVTIAGGDPISGTPITVASGETGTTTFPFVSLAQGTLNACFDIGTIT